MLLFLTQHTHNTLMLHLFIHSITYLEEPFLHVLVYNKPYLAEPTITTSEITEGRL